MHGQFRVYGVWWWGAERLLRESYRNLIGVPGGDWRLISKTFPNNFSDICNCIE